MRLLVVLFLLAASGASAQPLSIERVEAPASVASGAAVEIALTARVRNGSDSNKRYALTVVVGGTERARWTSPAALRPGRAESVPLAWTQAVSGSAVRGHVALLNTRDMELARASFEIPVARGEPAPPVISVPTPPIGPRPVPGIPRPQLPGGTPEASGGYEVRPSMPDTTPAPYISRSIGFTVTPHGPRPRNSSPRNICEASFLIQRGALLPLIEFWIANDGTEASSSRTPTQVQIDMYRRSGRPHSFERVGRRFAEYGVIPPSDPLAPGGFREVGDRFDLGILQDDFQRGDELLVVVEFNRTDDDTRTDRLIMRGVVRRPDYDEEYMISEILTCHVEDSSVPLSAPIRD